MTQKKQSSQPDRLRRMVYAALCMAIAMALPFVTGQLPQLGAMLSPMHIPALLCGFLCGWPWGLAVGFIAPLLRGAVFGMPELFPTGLAMAFELAVYGAVAGLLYSLLPRKTWAIYVTLIAAMVVGRLVWGAVQLVIAGASGNAFTTAAFLASAVIGQWPAIVLQLVLIPLIVAALEKNGMGRW